MDWTATFIHEMFHCFQPTHFQGTFGDQGAENYAYTADNLELATLEERTLAAVVTAEDATAREMAVRRFAAIRLVRCQAAPRVALDNDQERLGAELVTWSTGWPAAIPGSPTTAETMTLTYWETLMPSGSSERA